MDPTFVAEKVGQHLTKCVNYHQIKSNNPNEFIDFTISNHCCVTVKMVHPSTFSHLFVS